MSEVVGVRREVERPRRTVLGVNATRSLLGEFGLAHSLRPCEQEEGKLLGLREGVEVEPQLLLDIFLPD